MIAAIPTCHLAAYWNKPVFSQASSDPKLSDKKTYRTLVRVSPPYSKMGAVLVEVFRYFKWQRGVMISRRPVGTKFVFCDYASRSIEEKFRQESIILADWMKFSDGLADSEIDEILTRTAQRGRSKY